MSTPRYEPSDEFLALLRVIAREAKAHPEHERKQLEAIFTRKPSE